MKLKWTKLKALDTFGNCSRPVFSLVVSHWSDICQKCCLVALKMLQQKIIISSQGALNQGEKAMGPLPFQKNEAYRPVIASLIEVMAQISYIIDSAKGKAHVW